MRAYGQTRGGTAWDFEPSIVRKGGERLRVRVELQKAIGPVPPSITAKDDPPCQCEDCKDLGFAAWVRELEQGEHDHIDGILA